MTLNKEIFQRDPTTFSIPNDGVTTIAEPRTDEQWAVLRYELESFVCEGEYAAGMERVLSTFLTHLGQPVQPAVWVSGFYGSGKSHLVRVLRYLWQDPEFPEGETVLAVAERAFAELDDLARRAEVEIDTEILEPEARRPGEALAELKTPGIAVGGDPAGVESFKSDIIGDGSGNLLEIVDELLIILAHKSVEPGAVGSADIGEEFGGDGSAVETQARHVAVVPGTSGGLWRGGPGEVEVAERVDDGLAAVHLPALGAVGVHGDNRVGAIVAAYDQAAFDALLDVDGQDEFTIYVATAGRLPKGRTA